uniref:Uncharacterized protein n=1 Tax=Rhizophora mucronata TaxID=61149 RepID=A0A2P2JH94_RHIMU
MLLTQSSTYLYKHAWSVSVNFAMIFVILEIQKMPQYVMPPLRNQFNTGKHSSGYTAFADIDKTQIK